MINFCAYWVGYTAGMIYLHPVFVVAGAVVAVALYNRGAIVARK